MVKVVENCLPESVSDVLSEPVVESFFSAKFSLNEEAGRGLQQQTGEGSHYGCYCPSGGFIWRPLDGDTKRSIKLLKYL